MSGFKLSDYFYVTDFAQLQCTNGSIPGTLRVLPGPRPTIDGRAEANVRDTVPLVNLTPFGICAATQKPCNMPTLQGWKGHSADTHVGGALALLDCSLNLCGLGGQISVRQCGQRTPYVSTGPISGKLLRYNERLELLAAARAKLADGPVPAPPSPLVAPADATRVAPSAGAAAALRQQGLDLQNQRRLQAATDRLTRNNLAVERAKLADDSYENEVVAGPNGATQRIHQRKNPDGKTYSPSEPPEGWRVERVIEDKKSGFMAVMYASEFERPPRKVLVYRGTDVGSNADMATDAMQGIGMPTVAYKHAADVARRLKQQMSAGFDIAGHSLGGGQASQAGLLTGYDTYTFNAAGLHEQSIARAGITPTTLARNRRRVQAYYSENDPLNAMQDNPIKTKLAIRAIASPVTVLIPPPFPNPLDPILSDPRNLPPAMGIRHEMADAGGHYSTGHSIPPMVASIERQKEEDTGVITQFVPLP